MTKQSDESCQDTIRELNRAAHPLSFWPPSLDRRSATVCELIERAGRVCNTIALPTLCAFLLDNQNSIRTAACRSIDLIVRQWASDLEFCDDKHLLLRSYVSEQWACLKTADIERLIAVQSCRCSILGVLSNHASGFVRQEAVKLLSAQSNGQEFPFLLLRLNDWVQPVRADAERAMNARLTQGYIQHVVAHLPRIVHLLAFKRNDHSQTVREAFSLLAAPTNDSLLRNAIAHRDRNTRRCVLKTLQSLGSEAAQRAVRYGLQSSDSVMRLWSLRQASNLFSSHELSEVVEKCMADRSMPVRREALLRKTESADSPQSAVALWKVALLDRNGAIRDLAQCRLGQMGHEVASTYRKTLENEPRSVPALSGLSETGDSTDETLFRRYINDATQTRRRAALRGLCRVLKDRFVVELVERLHDNSPKVTREIERLLRDWMHVVSLPQLYQTAAEDIRPHVQSSALRLIYFSGKWTSLPWLLRSVCHPRPETGKHAEALIWRWLTCNRVFTRPATHNREQLLAALDAVASIAPENLLHALRQDVERYV